MQIQVRTTFQVCDIGNHQFNTTKTCLLQKTHYCLAHYESHWWRDIGIVFSAAALTTISVSQGKLKLNGHSVQ